MEEGRGSEDAGTLEKEVGYKQEFELHHGAAAHSLPLPVSGCHLSSKNMTNG